MDNKQQNDQFIDEQKLESLRSDVRAVSDYLEDRAMRNVTQVAYSTDGRTFNYEAPLTLPIPVGCYVHLKVGEDQQYLGQIITKEVLLREDAEINFGIDEQSPAALPDWMNITSTTNRIRICALEDSA